MSMILEYVRTMPFAQAVVIAGAAAFVCALLVGAAVTRITRGRGARRGGGVKRPTPRPVSSGAPSGPEPELSALIESFVAATERLDRAIESCLELSGRLSCEDVMQPCGAGRAVSPEPKPASRSSHLERPERCCRPQGRTR